MWNSLRMPGLPLVWIKLEFGKHVLKISELFEKEVHVYALYDITREYDFVLTPRFSTHEELFRFICALSAIRHVSHTTSEIVIKGFKEAFSVNFKFVK